MKNRIAASVADAGEREDAQISQLLTWLSATAIAFLIGIGTKAWFAGHTTHAWVLWSFIGLLFTYLIASGGESNTGPLWFYVFPPLLFYLTDLKTGTAVLLFCYLVAVVVFQFPGLPLVTAEYSTDFKIRFFAALTFESIFCFVLEVRSHEAQPSLPSAP